MGAGAWPAYCGVIGTIHGMEGYRLEGYTYRYMPKVIGGGACERGGRVGNGACEGSLLMYVVACVLRYMSNFCTI